MSQIKALLNFLPLQLDHKQPVHFLSFHFLQFPKLHLLYFSIRTSGKCPETCRAVFLSAPPSPPCLTLFTLRKVNLTNHKRPATVYTTGGHKLAAKRLTTEIVTGLLSQKAVYNDAISVGEVIRSCLNKPSIHTTKTCTALGAGTRTRVDLREPLYGKLEV